MLNPALTFLLYLLLASILGLFIACISKKLYMDARQKRNRKNKDSIESSFNKFIAGTDEEYNAGLKDFVGETRGRGSGFLAAIDRYLLETLDTQDSRDRGKRKRYVRIASDLGFPSECMAQIRSKKSAISAYGSRRAGFYEVTEAIREMVVSLDAFSGENQGEVLMAIARMGDADALQKALDKIKDNILINEREVIEILSVFPDGTEKKKLFKRMIHSDTGYMAALFLKASGREMTGELLEDIIDVLQKGNKDVRAAAIRSLATLDKEAPADILFSALEDKDWEVRALAAKALGPIRTPESSSALYQALYDRQWWVRQNAANALAGHPGYETLFILAAESGDEYVKDSIISTLENGVSPVLLRSIRIMVA